MVDNTEAIREIQRKHKANKVCSECGERGPGYVCMTHATFVCTTCSGILREFNFRVKGISASTFTDDEVTMFREGGNAKSNKIWLHQEPQESMIPKPQESEKIRRYLRAKYVEQRWCKVATKKKSSKKKVSSSESSSSDSEEERRKAKARKAKAKAKAKAKHKASSSSGSSSSESEEERPKSKHIKDVIPNAPKIVISGNAVKGKSSKSKSKHESPAKAPAAQPEEDLFGGWDAFESAPPAQTQAAAPSTNAFPPMATMTPNAAAAASPRQQQSSSLDDPFAMLSMGSQSSKTSPRNASSTMPASGGWNTGNQTMSMQPQSTQMPSQQHPQQMHNNMGGMYPPPQQQQQQQYGWQQSQMPGQYSQGGNGMPANNMPMYYQQPPQQQQHQQSSQQMYMANQGHGQQMYSQQPMPMSNMASAPPAPQMGNQYLGNASAPMQTHQLPPQKKQSSEPMGNPFDMF